MKNYILILGDILTIAMVTAIGFISHRETAVSVLPRVAAVFLPLLVSWFVLALLAGLFQEGAVSRMSQLWRPVLAMFFAASFAACLRGLILNAPVIPTFALVLGATSAFGMLVWRSIYVYIKRKMSRDKQEQY